VDNFPEYVRAVVPWIERDLRQTAPGDWSVTVGEAGQVEVIHDGRSATAVVAQPSSDSATRALLVADPRDRSADELAVCKSTVEAVQGLVSELGGDWPTCPLHRPTMLKPDYDRWRCSREHHRHRVARVGELSTQDDVFQARLKETDYLASRLDTLSLSLDASKRGAMARVIFQIHRPANRALAFVTWGAIWALTSPARDAPFTKVHIPMLPPWLQWLFLAFGLVFLSMTSIDVIVTVPLLAGWAGVFTLDQATMAIVLALFGHACFSWSVRRLLALRSAVDPDEWLAEHADGLPHFRIGLFCLSLCFLAFGIIRVHELCVRWAAHHHADPTLLFATACVGVCTLLAGMLLIARRRWNLGDRASDDLFRESFWALLGIFLAFLPAAVLASWAPILLGAIGVPLIIARSRVSVAKAAEIRAGGLRYWQPARSADGPARDSG
jgi:hypothetical protein